MSKHPIELIEEELGAFYPEDFKRFILAIQADKRVEFNIVGARYKLMNHLLSSDPILEETDDVIFISVESVVEDPGYIKLPFAQRDMFGSDFRYLYFLAKLGLAASPIVYFIDADTHDPNRLQIASSFNQLTDSYANLLNHINQSTTSTVVISTAHPTISHFLPPIPLPENISFDSTSQIVHRTYPSIKPENAWDLEFNVKLYRVKLDETVYYSIVHMNSIIRINGLCLESDIRFWIDGKRLQPKLERDVFLGIFYHRLAMIVNAVDNILGNLPREWTREQVLELMDQRSLDDICRTQTTEIDYGYY